MHPGANTDFNMWNDMAKPYSDYEDKREYETEFINAAGIEEGSSVLDMGSGSGTLSIPLAKAGHKVIAADFAVKMLELLEKDAREGNLDITCMELSWQDDWDEKNVPVCDYVIASRSLFSYSPDDAVKKMSAHARKKVWINIRSRNKETGLVSEYLLQMIAAVINQGYAPEIRYLPESAGGHDWTIISWETGK